jgi:isocitrate dehydrogenase (NAD+)
MGYTITLLLGDGIGPEVALATKEVLDSMDLDIDWDIHNAGLDVFESKGVLVPQEVYDSIEQNKIALKGPITTPIGKGFRSINVDLRKRYDLYTNIRPIQSLDASIDMVIFRENTQGLYIGEEAWEDTDTSIAIKRITRQGSRRIIKQAFNYAMANGRKKVTVVHKANILKQTDGLFLDEFRLIAKDYPLQVEEMIVDAMCMKMVLDPSQFDVIVTMNLYGDILSDLGAGLIGGLGLAAGANIGDDMAIFEAVHGSAPDIMNKGISNPIALLRSAVLMLRYLKEESKADALEQAIHSVLKTPSVLTPDLGGNGTTNSVTKAIIDALKGE